MSTPTPGPWTSEWTNDTGPDDDYYIEFFEILDSEHKRIGRAEEEADARLMAAAPELLEALKLADAMLSGANMNERVVEKKMRAAIAKAEGP